MENRVIDLPVVFGATANTVIPTYPTPGTGYRKDDLEAADIQSGWAFGEKVESSVHNQTMFIITSLLQQIAQLGGLAWCATTQYVKGGVVVASNGERYIAVVNNTNVDPVGATAAIWKHYTNDKPGKIVSFAMNSAPSGYLVCDGSAVSRANYPDLFAAIGVNWGIGDGGTTFNLPDLRAEFLRGWDNGRGLDPGRVFGSPQTGMVGPHTHPQTAGAYDADWGQQPASPTEGVGYSTGSNDSRIKLVSEVETDDDTRQNTGTETRPINIAVLYCIAI